MSTITRRRSLAALTGATAGLAGILAPTAATAAPVPTVVPLAPTAEDAAAATPADTVRRNIVNIALAELQNGNRNHESGAANCNFYTGWWGRGSSSGCPSGFRSEEWCADFAQYVWNKSGTYDADHVLNAGSRSFKDYGTSYGGWHGGDTKGIRPGDAVVWDDNTEAGRAGHVGIVATINGADIWIVSGNYGNHVAKHRLSDVSGSLTYLGYSSPKPR